MACVLVEARTHEHHLFGGRRKCYNVGQINWSQTRGGIWNCFMEDVNFNVATGKKEDIFPEEERAEHEGGSKH